MASFNPRPALGPGATGVWICEYWVREVSILARLWGRALLLTWIILLPLYVFQSSPGFGAGRYDQHLPQCHTFLQFQSSPGFGAGRYRRDKTGQIAVRVFQSSPGFGAGRYSHLLITSAASFNRFNPRPALGPGAT